MRSSVRTTIWASVLPSLTSIDVHCRQQAELSIRKLISFVCGEEYDPLRFLVPTELVQGDSVKQA